MNDAQYRGYLDYLRELANAMLLADWEVSLKRTAVSMDCYAQVLVMQTENHAVVRLAPEFLQGSIEDRREWLVHELLHCHLDRPHRIMEQLATQFGENTACAFASEAHGYEVEICVQRMARLLAPYLPLPPDIPAGES